MDQIKTQLAVLRKHGFWISTFLVAIIAVAVWYMATSSLQAESEKQISDLKAANASMDSIRNSIHEHPNSQSHELTKKMVAKQNAAVLDAWKSQYQRQQNILVWPEESLDKDFITRVKNLLTIDSSSSSGEVDANGQPIPAVPGKGNPAPIESVFSEFPVPPEKEIETRYLEAYRDYIGDVLPSKAEIVGAEWTAKFDAPAQAGGGMGMGMGMGMEMEMSMDPMMDAGMMDPTGMTAFGGLGSFGMAPQRGPLVKWSTSSQTEVLADLFPWRGSRPSTLEVLYSQENLWVLTQLLQIIADTNGDITQPFQAKIHEIEKIGIGRSAKRADGMISPVTAGGGSATGDDAMGMGMGMGMGMESDPMGMGMGMESDPMGMGMGMGMGMDGQTAMAIDPLASRYVDVNYEPIDAARVRAAMAPDNRSPEDAFLTVAKRLPVVLRVKMDQREIPRLVAACGNAALMVEVRQIRINPSTSGSSSNASMGMGMGMSPMESADTGMESEMGMGMGMGDGYGEGGGMSSRQTASYPMDVPVEIYGIIQIYNPPAMEKLGVDKVDSTTVVEGQAMGEQPVAEPTPDTTPRVQPGPAVTPPADAVTPPADATAPPADAAAPPTAGPPVASPPAADATAPAADATAAPAAGPPAAGPPAAGPPAAGPPATGPPAAGPPATNPVP